MVDKNVIKMANTEFENVRFRVSEPDLVHATGCKQPTLRFENGFNFKYLRTNDKCKLKLY
jgi:hypothetical protein